MKYLVWCFLLFAFNQSCGQSLDDENEINSVTYSASTRGSSYQCTIDKMSIKILSNEESNERRLSSKEWLAITTEINKISLIDFKNFEKNTNDSALDRSRIAKITILAKGKIYESTSFDEGNPPNELTKLLDIILTLAKTVE